MYALFFETLANIQYRIYKEEDKRSKIFYWIDSYIKKALEKALEASSTKGMAFKFIKALKPLFEMFRKDDLVNHFESDFIENEIVLEAEIKHESHILHVIRVFLIGYNIITSWPYLIDKFKNSSHDSFFKFSRFCLSWLMASLFHDFGYIIEKTHERYGIINRQYREILQGFKGIKSLPEEPLDIGENITIVRHLYKLYKERLHKNLTLNEFINLFKVGSSEVRELDHGFVSAICFIEMIEIAQKQYDQGGYRNSKFIDKEMNIYASLAMLLHNFHMIQFNEDDGRRKLSLNCSNKAEIIPYLLMLCDVVQVWDRTKQNYDNINKESDNIIAYKKLEFCKFGDNLVIFQINHILQYKSKFSEYANKLGWNFLSKQEKITMEIEYLYPNGEITIFEDLEENIRSQKKIEEQPHFILNPMEEDGYKIVLNHLIEGIHYYTIIYYI